MFSSDDTIVAIATPSGRGGIGVVRVSGSNATEIAARLGLREQTIKIQLSTIYGKLGLRNRLELAVRASNYAASDVGEREG